MREIEFAFSCSAHTQSEAFLTEVPKWNRTLAAGLLRNSCPPAASQVQTQVGRSDTLYSTIQAFATSGIGKIFGWSANVAYMNTRHLPLIPVLLAAAMVIEVAGSVCLVTGYRARVAAFVMFWYTTAVTLLLHNYWASSEMMAAMQEMHFRKNLAIMGGLLMLAYGGPGKWALGPPAVIGKVEASTQVTGNPTLRG